MTKAGFYLLKGSVFPYDVLICLGTTEQQIKEYATKRFENCFTDRELELLSELSKKKGYTLRLENGAYLLWTALFPTTPEGFEHLAHETFHVADLMLRRAGLTLSDDSDEAFAYLIGWITKNIYTEFKLASQKR
jgi:hypothetical protein